MRNKLTVDARMLRNSGIGVYLESLIDLLPKKSDYLFLIDPNDTDFFLSRDLNFKCFDKKIYSITEQIDYRGIIPPSHIFWSPHYNVPIFPIKSDKRIVTIHDVYHLANRRALSLKQSLYAGLLMQTAVKSSDHIITVSEFSKQEIVKYTGCDSEKIHVIYNGVKTDVHHKEWEVIKNKYNIPSNYFLYVGNVKPHKNLKVLCMAFLRLPLDIQTAYKIVIVGKREGFITGDQNLFDLINANTILKDRILFTGYVDGEDMDSIYHYAKIFVFPSLYEGFGLPPLEAMANSTPTICAEAASIPEICGDASLYFDPNSAESLLEKLMELLDNVSLQNTLISSGKIRVNNFSWKESINKHLGIFNL